MPALRRFLDVQRCAPDARPGRADVKACVGAVLGALRELEARRDALSYEALLVGGPEEAPYARMVLMFLRFFGLV